MLKTVIKNGTKSMKHKTNTVKLIKQRMQNTTVRENNSVWNNMPSWHGPN